MFCKGEGRLLLSDSQTIALGSIFFIESLFLIFTNVLLLLAMIRTNQVDTTSNKYIFVLNFSDLLIGSVGLPLYGILFTLYGTTPVCGWDEGAKFILNSNFYFTAFMLLSVALDRSRNIDPEINSPCRIGEFIKSSTGFNLTLTLLLVVALSFGAMAIIERTVTLLILTFAKICILLAYILLYIHLYRKIRQFTKKTRDIINSMEKSQTMKCKTHYETRLRKTVFILVGLAILCYVPSLIIRLVALGWRFGQKESVTQTIWLLYYLSLIPVFANSGLNSIILLHKNRKMRNYTVNLLWKRTDTKERNDQDRRTSMPSNSHNSTSNRFSLYHTERLV